MYLGGPKHFDKVLGIFESLCLCDDEEVRLKATTGLQYIIEKS
jgi:hypothetical protein